MREKDRRKDDQNTENHRGRGERADVRELTGEDGRSMAADIRWSVPAVSQRSVRGEAHTSGVEVGVTCCSRLFPVIRQNFDAGTETLSK